MNLCARHGVFTTRIRHALLEAVYFRECLLESKQVSNMQDTEGNNPSQRNGVSHKEA